MIHVLAKIDVVPGQRDAFLARFRQLMPKVHAEEGCVEYGPVVDADTPIAAQTRLGNDVVMVIERWESVAALQDHLSAAHMAEYRDSVKNLVTNVTLHVLESI